MKISFHTPKGIVEVDSETVTNDELAAIGLTRQNLNDFLAEQPRDLAKAIDVLETKVEKLEKE